MWDRRVVEKVEAWEDSYSIACSFRSVSDDFKWAFAGVYGPNVDNDRLVLWNELSGLMERWAVLEETLMQLGSQVRDLVILDMHLLWRNSPVLSSIMGLWTFL
jgi:hypothetical protein